MYIGMSELIFNYISNLKYLHINLTHINLG